MFTRSPLVKNVVSCLCKQKDSKQKQTIGEATYGRFVWCVVAFNGANGSLDSIDSHARQQTEIYGGWWLNECNEHLCRAIYAIDLNSI